MGSVHMENVNIQAPDRIGDIWAPDGEHALCAEMQQPYQRNEEYGSKLYPDELSTPIYAPCSFCHSSYFFNWALDTLLVACSIAASKSSIPRGHTSFYCMRLISSKLPTNLNSPNKAPDAIHWILDPINPLSHFTQSKMSALLSEFLSGFIQTYLEKSFPCILVG